MRQTTRIQRLDYTREHLERYTIYLGEIERSPFGPISLMEFACISANTGIQSAIDGWTAIRDLKGVTEIAEALLFWGVNAPFLKASYVVGIRRLPMNLFPSPLGGDWRTQRKEGVPQIKGIGFAKYSFTACLSHPLDSRIVCLDTIMAQSLTGTVPGKSFYAATKKAHQYYEYLEDIILEEADVLGVPAFLHQFAVWDLTRKLLANKPTEPHSFLWQKGPDYLQLVMKGLREID